MSWHSFLWPFAYIKMRFIITLDQMVAYVLGLSICLFFQCISLGQAFSDDISVDIIWPWPGDQDNMAKDFATMENVTCNAFRVKNGVIFTPNSTVTVVREKEWNVIDQIIVRSNVPTRVKIKGLQKRVLVHPPHHSKENINSYIHVEFGGAVRNTELKSLCFRKKN